jgi:hypothetical protein
MAHRLDSKPEEHAIVFYRGKMVNILCPTNIPLASRRMIL